MSGPLRRGRPAAPVRLVHLGLGNFFRAHQAWYTDRAPDAADWGYAAFGGRGGAVAGALAGQGGAYTLVTRAADADRFDVVDSLSRVHAAGDQDAWLGLLASPELRAVTLTVTEAGYLLGPDGGLDRERPQVRAEAAALRRARTAPVAGAPARLVAGLAARRQAGAGPIALVPCDNLPGNGGTLARVVRELAELVDPSLADWIDTSVPTVTTMVDRITPRTTPEDAAAVAAATGADDAAPVVTEPFAEWVLSGAFPAGRPDWAAAGARFADDVTPFEERKLWLLNGGHSLLAYAGLLRGHGTVARALADPQVAGWLDRWWAEASGWLTLPEPDLAGYRSALLDRFGNPRIRHLLQQIASDGSQKLPVRILPVLARERAAGRLPAGATLVLAAWVCALRDPRLEFGDVRGADLRGTAGRPLPEAVPRLLAALDPALADDAELVAGVLDRAREFAPADPG